MISECERTDYMVSVPVEKNLSEYLKGKVSRALNLERDSSSAGGDFPPLSLSRFNPKKVVS